MTVFTRSNWKVIKRKSKAQCITAKYFAKVSQENATHLTVQIRKEAVSTDLEVVVAD